MLYLINVKKYNNKSSTQLWEEDRKTFYWWIIGFIASLVVIIGIFLAGIIIFGLDRQQIIDYLSNKYPNNSENEIISFYNWQIVSGSIQLCLLFVVLILLITSFVSGIKQKTFSKIPFLPTVLIFFLTFYSFFDLISYAISNVDVRESFEASSAFVLFFALRFIYLVVYFVFSRNVAMIRRLFLIIQTQEAVTKNFQDFVQYGQNMKNNQVNSNGSNFGTNSNSISSTEKDKNIYNDELFQRLSSLNRAQLNNIAEKLSISSYETMGNDELLKIIYSIYKITTNENNKDNLENENDKQN